MADFLNTVAIQPTAQLIEDRPYAEPGAKKRQRVRKPEEAAEFESPDEDEEKHQLDLDA